MLIRAQKPGAIMVQGFKKWSEMGYQVKKGQKAIKILAPTTKKKKIKVEEKNEKGEKVEKTKEVKKTQFIPVNVFDKSQVKYTGDGQEPVKGFFEALGDDFENVYKKFKKQVAESKKTEIIEEELDVMGVSLKGKIKIDASLDFNNKLLTLIHELAHELLHEESKEAKQIKEMQAEAVSYVVGQYLGLNNPYSSDYIQCFGNTVEELKQNLQIIIKTSREVIEIYEGKEKKEKAA